MAPERDTEGPDCLFGAGQSGPTLLHFSNIARSLNPTKSTSFLPVSVIMSCRKRKRHKALICEAKGN